VLALEREVACTVESVPAASFSSEKIAALPAEALTGRSFATLIQCTPGVVTGSSGNTVNVFIRGNAPFTNAPVPGQPGFYDAVAYASVGNPFDPDNLPPLDASKTWTAPSSEELNDGWGQWAQIEVIKDGQNALYWNMDLPISQGTEKTYILLRNVRVNVTDQNGPRANVAPERFLSGTIGSTTDGVTFDQNMFALGRTRQGIFTSTSTAVNVDTGVAASITRVFEGIERDALIRASQDPFGEPWVPRIGFRWAVPEGVDAQFRFQNHYDTGSPGVLGDGMALTRIAGAAPDGSGGARVDPLLGGDFTTSDGYVFYEMTDSDPAGLEFIDLNWSATFSGNLTIENWQNIQYAASLAPLSTVGEPSANAPNPRFYDFGIQNPGGVCTSFSLFPYVDANTGTADGVAVPLCDPFLHPGAIFSSSSFLPGRSSNGLIARSSFFTGYGSGFPAIATGLSWPLQDQLDGLGVEMRPAGGGEIVPAIPIASNGFQFNGIATRNTPLGDLEIRVRDFNTGRFSNWVSAQGAEVAHGILTTTANGRGSAIAQKVVGNERIAVSPFHPLVAGDIVSIYGSGDGAGQNDDHIQPAVVDNRGFSVIYIGSTMATEVFYIGKSYCCSALTEYIFRMPHLDSYGFNTPVQICASTDGPCSNVATLPVFGEGATPADELDFFNTRAYSLQASGNFGRLELNLSHFYAEDSQDELVGSAAEGRFFGYDPLFDYSPTNNPPPPGSCVSFAGSGDPTATLSPDPRSPLSFPLGMVTRLDGSSFSRDLQWVKPGVARWAALGPADPPDPGADWRFNDPAISYGFDWANPGGGNGTDVGEFSHEFDPFNSTVWPTFPEEVTLGQDFTINWDGGDDSLEFIRIGLLAQDPVTGEFGAVDCTARASDGSFTISGRHTQGFPIDRYINPVGIDGFVSLSTSTYPDSVAPAPQGTDGVSATRTTSFGGRVRLNYDF
jgi:uncharacterized protein (TIGR03437 family)